MRTIIGLLHRWVGLALAVFLFVSGLTGAVISWDHELDDALNPHLMHASSSGEATSVFEVVKRFEVANPAAQVTFFRLANEKGESGMFAVQPRVNPASGQLYDLDYNQVYFDPVTGAELGRRKWGAVWPITRETFVSFLYRLHYTLHIPRMWGTDRVGYWLMGVIALVWTVDCFFGFYLTLPARRKARAARAASVERELGKGFWQRWKPAWRVKTTGSAYRINFDLHRAFGLWTWVLLFVIAFTGFSLNLYREVFYPIMATVSQVTPSAFMKRTPTAIEAPIAPVATYEEILALAKAEAQARGWTAPVGSMFYARRVGLYGVTFFKPEDGHGVGGVGNPALYYDSRTAALEGDRTPWKGTAADIFLQAQFPLHSGRILGLPGRILISIMGIVVAMLSVTGVYIWYRKRAARIRQQSGAYAVRLAPAE